MFIRENFQTAGIIHDFQIETFVGNTVKILHSIKKNKSDTSWYQKSSKDNKL
jgi:hypothetical protein